MKFINSPAGNFFDRSKEEPEIEAIDVLLPTLDAVNFLEKALYTIYKEIPIRKLFVCDGGSKDGTIEILKKFPRMELHIKPDIKTGGKYIEFLLALVETKWFVIVDADRELSPGWYDEMCKHQNEYDVLENSRTVSAYHKYIEDKEQLMKNSRSGALCHLAKKEAFKDWNCDDDYMWRQVDIMFRHVPEKSGFKYGKIDTTLNIHNETDRIPYSSDVGKSYRKLIIPPPYYRILDKKKAKRIEEETAKGAVKYFDPNFVVVRDSPGFDFIIRGLDRKWIEENNSEWLQRYDKTHSLKFTIMFYAHKYIISKNKKILTFVTKIYKK